MRNSWTKGLLVGLAVIVSLPALAQGKVGFGTVGGGLTIPPTADHSPDHIVVKVRPGVSEPMTRSLLAQHGLTINEQRSNQYFIIADMSRSMVVAGVRPAAVAYRLQRSSAIVWAEIDPIITRDFTPDDARFDELWGLHNTGQSNGKPDADIDATEAWDRANLFNDVVVAVCDDGFDIDHEDLKDNLYVKETEVAGNGIDDDGNGFIDDVSGWDFIDGDNDPRPTTPFDSHGTHVAGTIAATHNNGIGISGVGMNNIKYMPLKMYGSGVDFGTYMSSLAAAVNYAADEGVAVISVSYNIDSFTQALDDAIGNAKAKDVIYCNSAGNAGRQDPPRLTLRDKHDNVIFVASSTRNDTKSGFSNYGSLVEIAAPGSDILSTLPGNSYGSQSGTSMATPHVSGVIGMLRSVDDSATSREILDIMIEFADVAPGLNNTVPGNKRLNLNNALIRQAAIEMTITPLLGTHMMGDMDSLAETDEDMYEMQSQELNRRGQYTLYEIVATPNNNDDPINGVSYSVTTSSSMDGAYQQIYLYNYETGRWDRFDAQRLRTGAVTEEFSRFSGMGDYGDPISGAVKMRVMTMVPLKRRSVVAVAPFMHYTDHVMMELYR